uniref:Uncharacterized protein n=1 Tax=Oryza barthii TaxID=65489 RepID=A0A0D3GH70_9ORYZ
MGHGYPLLRVTFLKLNFYVSSLLPIKFKWIQVCSQSRIDKKRLVEPEKAHCRVFLSSNFLPDWTIC